MANEETKKLNIKPHTLTLDDRARLSVTGVEDVLSFDESVIVMNTAQGDLLVRGSGLHIGRIALDSGELRVEGLICELSYEDRPAAGSFWQRLFG